jgi:hypothetical protein
MQRNALRPLRPSNARPAAAALAAALSLAACASSAAVSQQHAGGGAASTTTKSAPSSTSTTTTTTTLGPVKEVAGKVNVLEIGDSLGIDLGWGLQWALRNDSHVRLFADAKGDTGLSNALYYNWPAVLRSLIASTHPQIVVIFLGGNDAQGLSPGGEAYGTAAWEAGYRQRVAEMMNEATAAGARVLWVGMPIMQPTNFSAEMAHMDTIYRSEASLHKGVTYFSSWQIFATPTGQYNGGTTDVAGYPSPLRDPDGIHLATGGAYLLGQRVVEEMRSLYKLP